jgi:hypothetical protein
MADLKISALTGATTPLAGTEVLPIVQSGSTKKVAVSDLTAGRAVSAASLSLTTSPLPTASGGTALSSFTAQGVLYASGANTLATGSVLVFDGTSFRVKGSGVGTNYNAIYVDNNSGGSGSPPNTVSVNFSSNGSTKNSITGAVYGNGYLDFATDNNTVKWRMDATGNLIPQIAAKGINFTANTPAAGMTSQLLNWYEEGTWTPTYAFWTIDPTNVYARYTRVGRLVTLNFVAQDGVSVAGNSTIGGLPFTSSNVNGASVAMKDIVGSSPGITAFGAIVTNSTSIGSMTSATFTGTFWAFSTTYMV